MKLLIKNLSNALTLLRVMLTLFLNYYTINYFSKVLIPVVLTFFIFLTDILDGKLARLFKITSPLGAFFDVVADLFYIVLSYIVLLSFNLLPIWFLIVIILKFVEFVITSFFLRDISKEMIFFSDLLGRIIVIIFYVLPIATYISVMFSQFLYLFIIHIFLYIICFMAFVSSALRIKRCIH
ncbi:CDP-diacylglycerol--glycerol-3-phosphate 3-phosphatidyltransferase [Clostridium acetobutylicum]|nr:MULTISPECIES: CDP-alcohol phosphatidyltransferase family protein [Clostridium]ADZ21075.1 Membrane protein [Clostridium acetobutylicum EA 2018]AEI32131.1 Membrane protein [Clostridium acetobutylicum DSM 1731]AWV79587.1 CDP-alcohol phosphatidyltransferase family protein [Clostridium acetobutylicum]MBC2394440.1 CDP-alcohol phosphatidyltransferase family protein [Clostridium acetobutylicum]MBC2583402.1 CDP-alcohol phosphatidyltransferase family protein [Clostridium acetobutylicum]